MFELKPKEFSSFGEYPFEIEFEDIKLFIKTIFRENNFPQIKSLILK